MIGATTRRTPGTPDPAQTRDDEKDHQVSKPKLFPAGHPFAENLPVGASPFDVADQLIAYRRAQFGGWTMKDDDDDPDDDGDDDPDDDDDAIDPETIIKVGDKEIAVKDLQSKMAREKRQGRSAGTRETLKALGFDSLDDAKSFVTKHKGTKPKPAPKSDDDDEDVAAAKQAAADAQRQAEATTREAKAKSRRADLKGALAAAGVPRTDLDDALALLDRTVDAEYDDDDLDDAVEELKGRRPALFGSDGEGDDDEDNPKPKARTKAKIPEGRPKRTKSSKNTGWDRGKARAERRWPTQKD